MSEATISRAPSRGNEAGVDRVANDLEHSQELLRDVASIDTSQIAGISFDDPNQETLIDEPNMGLVRQEEHLSTMIADMTGQEVGDATLEELTLAVAAIEGCEMAHCGISELGGLAPAQAVAAQAEAVERVIGA